MADGDPLDEYRLDGARADPLDTYRAPPGLRLGDARFNAIINPPTQDAATPPSHRPLADLSDIISAFGHDPDRPVRRPSVALADWWRGGISTRGLLEEAAANAPPTPFGSVRGPRVWYRGDPQPFPLSEFDPARTGSANSGFGAFFLSPSSREAGRYGQVREFVSDHSRPFVWDLDNFPDTLRRAQEIWPRFNPGRNNDVWWLNGREHTTEFIDRLRRAGFDAIEMRLGGNTRELAVFDPSRTLRPTRRDGG